MYIIISLPVPVFSTLGRDLSHSWVDTVRNWCPLLMVLSLRSDLVAVSTASPSEPDFFSPFESLKPTSLEMATMVPI